MTFARRRLLALAAATAGVGGLGAAVSPLAAAGRGRQSWGSFRGMTCAPTVTAADIADFAALGGTLLRPSFASMPLMSKTPPYGLNQAAFARLDQILQSCRQNGVSVVVDPHTFPGLRDDYTTFPDDELWGDYRFHDLAEQLWSSIASRYRDAGDVIAGYDLLNEPAVKDVRADSGTASWNELALRLTAAIREHDKDHHVIVGTAISPKPQGSLWYTRFESANELPPPPDAKIVVSPHMYTPHAFTHQGVSDDYPEGPTYPGTVAGKDFEGLPPSTHFDSAALADYLSPALTYAEKHGVPIYVGEFGAVRWAGESGNTYLEDCLRYFEEHGWSWTYHSWREWHGWDPEMTYDKNDTTRYPTTPRLELLRRYLATSGRNASMGP